VRRRLVEAIGLLLALMLSSCRSSQPTAGKTTITLSGWESNPIEKQRLQKVLQDFEAEHPTIEVKYETIADQYMDVIKTRLIGRQAPDVFYLDSFEAPALISRNVLEPLDPFVTPGFDQADFQPALVEVFRANNQTYGFPKDFSTLALFYNKRAFAAAGLTTPPQTWEQLRAYAQKLTLDRNGDGKIDQYGLGITPDLARLHYLLKAYGGQLVDDSGKAAFASDASRRGLALLIDQYRQDKTAVQASDVGTSSGSEMFGQGKVAMVIEGPWALPYLQETFPELAFGTAEVPTVNGKPGTMIYTVAYVMNQQSQHKQAAWELIAYLTGKAGMKAWTADGIALPARASVAAELKLAQDPLRSAFMAGVNYGTPWEAGVSLPTIATNFNNQFVSALLGQQPLQQALEKAQTTANQEIQASQGSGEP
jgi:multiple sugar transport system substrate-binding protein